MISILIVIVCVILIVSALISPIRRAVNRQEAPRIEVEIQDVGEMSIHERLEQSLPLEVVLSDGSIGLIGPEDFTYSLLQQAMLVQKGVKIDGSRGR